MAPIAPIAPVDIRIKARQVVQANSAFSNCPPDVIDEIMKRSIILTYKADEIVFKQGERGDHMMVIVSGALKVSKRNDKGREIELGYLRRGSLIGEIAAIDGRERTATVVALEPAKAVAIYREDLQSILRANPDAMFGLLEAVCLRLRRTNTLLESQVPEKPEPAEQPDQAFQPEMELLAEATA